MRDRLKIGVIFGGRSGEHEVSLQSAAAVIAALKGDRYQVLPIGITKDGTWLVGADALHRLTAQAMVTAGRAKQAAVRATPMLEGGVLAQQIDVAFPLVHGTFGEDGSLQGLLELAQVPYVGAGVLASAAGMDKAIMKDIFRQHGIPTVESLVVLRKHWFAEPASILSRIEAQLGYPCFVKPANLGSSVGISKAHDNAELLEGVRAAAQYDRKIVVERAVPGCREIEVAVLGNDDPMASVAGEIVPGHEFYDYAAKYLDEGTRLIIPAELCTEQADGIRNLAIAAFKALDCCGMARVDSFLSSADGRVYVNEVNTIPGFTRGSMYPKLWAHGGLALPELLDRLIELAIERFEDKSASRTSYR